MRLCLWLAAGGVQCSACFNSRDSMWWYTWTGKKPQKHWVWYFILSLCWLLSVCHITCDTYTAVWSPCVIVLWPLWTVPDWWPGSRHKLHFHGLCIETTFNLMVIQFIFILLLSFSVCNKPLCLAGGLCRQRVLQFGDVHLPAGAESQMAGPYYAPTWKPWEQTDYPSLWLLRWNLNLSIWLSWLLSLSSKY